MEMEEITKEVERDDEDAGASNPILETRTEEEAEPDPYSKLQNPAEDVYSEAYYGEAPLKTKPAGKQTGGNTRLYRAVCVFLTLICLALLLAVIILSVKLQTGSTVCPEREQAAVAEKRTPSFASTCSYEQCQAHFSNVQPQRRNCQQCANGWLTLGRSCFFLSNYRLSWYESQKNCSAKGGSLAVISSLTVQRFLTTEGKLSYWIGLRQSSDTWTWVNNTALQQSYWAEGASKGDCGMLRGSNPPEKNWMTASCQAYTYFICQLEM